MCAVVTSPCNNTCLFKFSGFIWTLHDCLYFSYLVTSVVFVYTTIIVLLSLLLFTVHDVYM